MLFEIDLSLNVYLQDRYKRLIRNIFSFSRSNCTGIEDGLSFIFFEWTKEPKLKSISQCLFVYLSMTSINHKTTEMHSCLFASKITFKRQMLWNQPVWFSWFFILESARNSKRHKEKSLFLSHFALVYCFPQLGVWVYLFIK